MSRMPVRPYQLTSVCPLKYCKQCRALTLRALSTSTAPGPCELQMLAPVCQSESPSRGLVLVAGERLGRIISQR
jgi:hypothetical protein